MGDKSSEPLLQYINGEISFAEWLERDNSKGKSQKAETSPESKEDPRPRESEIQDFGPQQHFEEDDEEDGDEELPDDSDPSEINTSTVPSPASVTESKDAPEVDRSTYSPQPSTSRGLPARMTDLLLGLPAAKKARKHGGTSVDEFLAEIPSMSRKRGKTGRPKRDAVPQKFRRQIGEANISCAKGDYERAKEICIEIIKQVPKCAEPFELLGMVYEMQKDTKKALQFFLITAYLKRSEDIEEWLKLASMSLEQENYKQALACYNQALKHDPDNVSILWEKAALCYQMGDIKKAMDSYQMVLKALPSEDVERFMDLATEMAMIYHEHDSLKDAIEVMEMAFSRNPTYSDYKAINLLSELYMTAKHYSKALKFICTSCPITQEMPAKPSSSEPLSSFSDILGYDREKSPQKKTVSVSPLVNMDSKAKWVLHQDIPIDLRVKTAVCLIYIRCLGPVQGIIAPLFLESVENIGDLYLDVAEAYAENSDYDEALPIFDILVACEKYNQAGVWLKKAQSLMSLARLEEAAMAFHQVVALAPGHLEARLTLASLLQQLGQHEQALDILTSKPSEQEHVEQAMPMETSDEDVNQVEEEGPRDTLQPQEIRLLYHKCALLKSQERMAEFTDTACQMFAVYFSDVYRTSTDDLLETANSMVSKNRKTFWGTQSNKKTGDTEVIEGDDSVVRKDEWYEMLKQVVIEVSKMKHHETALRLVLCGLASDKLRFCKEYQKELHFMAVIALFLANRKKKSFDFIRQIIIERPTNITLWNIFGRLVANTEDSRYHRYCLRQLIKHPDLLPLVITNGHNSFVASSYKFAIAEYVRAFRQSPDNPMISLCLGIQYLHLAGQRFPVKRHSILLQGFLFLFQYMNLRGEGQEAYYNIGRAFHQMGLFHFAVHYYKKALACPYHNSTSTPPGEKPKLSDKHDLHREAAYNLSLIYRASGNLPLAKETIAKYIVI